MAWRGLFGVLVLLKPHMGLVYRSTFRLAGIALFLYLLEVGDGSNVLFKKDHCFGNGSVRQSYPELFKIAAHGDAFVFDYVDLVNGSLQWKSF